MTDQEFVCICDCECSKNNDRPNDQCDDCDNGIHWDNIKHKYVNYEDKSQEIEGLSYADIDPTVMPDSMDDDY